jgi:hypothetical protein
MLRAAPEEIVLTRNTSEANNLVSSGLPLKAGDEVIVFDDNHPSNHAAWREKGARAGFAVEIVPAPSPHPGPEYFVEAFIKKTTPRTKLWTFTHVTSTVGDQLPAKDLCAAARERGILTHLDGAQTFGVLDVDLSDLQPDFYSGSAHKWPCGPREVGLLFVNRRVAPLAPSVISLYAGAVGASKTLEATDSAMTLPSRRSARQSRCGIRSAPRRSSVRRESSRARSSKAFERSTVSKSGPTPPQRALERSSRFSPPGSIRARSGTRSTRRIGLRAPYGEEPTVQVCASHRTSTTRRRKSTKSSRASPATSRTACNLERGLDARAFLAEPLVEAFPRKPRGDELGQNAWVLLLKSRQVFHAELKMARIGVHAAEHDTIAEDQ